MSNVPTNLIPTRITQLPEYVGTSTLGYMPYVIDGRTYKVQFTNIAAVGAVPSTRVIGTGDGLQGGGDLSQDRTLSIIPHGVGFAQLDFTGVVANTYGGADTIPSVTIDATGRVTAIVDTPVVLANYVPSSRTVSAGAGLTGGGQLNSNITLALDPSNATPEPLGAASAGIGLLAAREDHVHPAVDLTDTTETQGVLPLGRGGTGDAISPVVGAVIYADNDSLNQTTAGNAGQLLTSAGGSGAPFWQTLVAGSNITISQGSGTITINATGGGGGGGGTVTSVSGTGTVSGLTLTGTVTTSGSLTLGGTLAVTPANFASQTANTFLAAPNGVAGAPTFRTIVAADVPTLNQNTTGTAANVTGTVAVANGGTGQTSYTDGQLLVGNTTGNTLAKATLTAGSGITITNGPGSITIDATGGGTGTVTSVGLSGGTTGLTATSDTTNPITTSGTFTLGGTLAVANGGTGATNASDARTNLVAAKSGANSDITSMSGITGGISLVDNIDFDTTSVVAGAVGRFVWNDGDGTLDLGLKGGNVTLQVGQEDVQRSFNEAGVGIVEGNVVYVSGAQGNRIAVSIAQANTAATSTGTIGMATENIANGAEGFITSQGLVRKLNTILDSEGNALTEGDLLYLSATVLGGYTKIEPAEPNFAVFVGYVVRVSATVGSIFIRPNVYPSIGEINKVSIVSTASGNTLIYDAVAGYYKTNTLTAGTNVSITNGPGSITVNATDQFTGTVTSVGGTGTVNGITLTGTVTTSGSLTLGGTLSGVSLTSQVSGTLPVANGGTNSTATPTAGGVAYGTGTAYAVNTAGTSGQVLTSAGAGAPTWTTPTTGTVTSVTGTAPVVSSGGATPAISMAAATALVSGYLTSTDWATFNGKGVGTVTSVGGTGTVSGLTLTGTVTTSGSLTLGGTLAVTPSNFASQTANTVLAAPNGVAGVPTFRAIVAADVPTLNQNTTGTAANVTGTVAVANGGTGATTLTANNVILGNGTTAVQFVAPGTNGNVLTSNGTTWTSAASGASLLGVTDSATPFETSLGFEAGLNTTGVNNTFLGYQAGKATTTGTDNTAVGFGALDVNDTGRRNAALGSGALGANTTGDANVAVGRSAMLANTTASNNTAVGDTSSRDGTTATNNTSVGSGSLSTNTTGSANTAIGRSALSVNSVSTNNTAVGFSALGNGAGPSEGNVAVGYFALYGNTTGTYNVAVGWQAGDSITTGGNNIIIGNNADASSATTSNETTIGNSSTTSARIFGDLKFLKSYTETVFAVVDAAGAVLDPNSGSIQTWTLGASRTPTQANWAAGQSITLMIDDGTAYTVTWTTLGVVWKTNGGVAPTLATTGYTVIVLWKVGTTIYGARVGDA